MALWSGGLVCCANSSACATRSKPGWKNFSVMPCSRPRDVPHDAHVLLARLVDDCGEGLQAQLAVDLDEVVALGLRVAHGLPAICGRRGGARHAERPHRRRAVDHRGRCDVRSHDTAAFHLDALPDGLGHRGKAEHLQHAVREIGRERVLETRTCHPAGLGSPTCRRPMRSFSRCMCMSEKPGMSHLPRPSMARIPFGTGVPAVAVIEAMRPSRIVTVMSASGAPPGVIGRTVTCVIATGSGAGAGVARQFELTNSNIANRRDMVIPMQMMGLRRAENETGCVARRKELGEGQPYLSCHRVAQAGQEAFRAQPDLWASADVHRTPPHACVGDRAPVPSRSGQPR